MAEYIVQKPVDSRHLTAKARKSLPAAFDVTPKFDGCCCVLAFDQSSRFAGAFSATGEYVVSMQHVGEWLAGHWRGLHGLALIGEAWVPGTDFAYISGLFRRKSVQHQLRFAPFDAARWEHGNENYPLLADPRPYWERVGVMLDQRRDPAFVVPVPHVLAGIDAANDIAATYKAQGGYDGAIARDQHAPYVVGRSKAEVIKLKPVLALDLRCVNYEVEPGVKTGRPVVTLVVELPSGRFNKVGSGVPHHLDGAETVGKIVEVEAMGWTADGYLREPRFKGVRYDKTETDK